MEHPAAEASDGPLKIDFDRRLKLDFHGSKITWFGPRPAPEAAGMPPLDLGETEHTVIRAYLQNHPKPQSPADLAGHNCLLYAHAVFGHEWRFFDMDGNTVVARVSGNLVTTSAEAMRTVALAGGGLWLAPPHIISDLLASGALIPLLRDYRTQEVEIVALYPHHRSMTAKVRLFIDMLVDRFADEQRWLNRMRKKSTYCAGYRV
jgi:DNA-binding transcriptional LysR family regulator